ncbi:unnamed protein product, partial [Discosporangium mesarthrocarpum]
GCLSPLVEHGALEVLTKACARGGGKEEVKTAAAVALCNLLYDRSNHLCLLEGGVLDMLQALVLSEKPEVVRPCAMAVNNLALNGETWEQVMESPLFSSVVRLVGKDDTETRGHVLSAISILSRSEEICRYLLESRIMDVFRQLRPACKPNSLNPGNEVEAGG